MSGIAAIYDGGAAPVARDELLALLAAIAHRGPRQDAWLGPGVALGWRILPTTGGAEIQGLPVRVAGERYQIALDGRIDNRDELSGALGLDLAGQALTDAALIVLAYERWGTGSPGRLIGDFAFVLWDATDRSLFAARDQRGFRPLVYARAGRRVIIGSEPQQLFACPNVPRTTDVLFFASHLTGAVPAPGATPYASVCDVPPAHYLLARGDNLSLHEYWRIGLRPALHYKRREEYVEHFESVFGQAVASAVRSPAPPAVLLSGGLDSSYLLARACEVAPEVRAYHAYVEGTQGMDERRYARAVGERLDVTVQEIAIDDCWSLSSRYLSDPAFDQPNVPMQGALMARLAQAARDGGAGVLLDGMGGDEFMSSSVEYISEFVLRGRWAHAVAESRDWARESGLSTMRVLATAGLAPLVPPSLRGKYRAWRGRPAPDPLPPWVDGEALRALGLERALETPEAPPVWRKDADLQLFSDMHRREALPVIAWRERRASLPAGVESRSPFWDLRVVELLLRFPSWVHGSGGRSKALLRDAMHARLPDTVVERTDKGAFDELMNAGLLEHESDRVESALFAGPLSRLLYIDRLVLEAEWLRYRRRQHRWWHALWRTITAGLWLRAEEEEEVVSDDRRTRQLVDA